MAEGTGGQKDLLIKPEGKESVVEKSKRTFLKGLLTLGAGLFSRANTSELAPGMKPREELAASADTPSALLRGSSLTKSNFPTRHQKDTFSDSPPSSIEKPPEKLSPSEVKEANEYKKQLEERFKIKIASYKEVPDDVKNECKGIIMEMSENSTEFNQSCDQIPDIWNIQGLKILESTLTKLPSHFYESAGKEPTLFVLSREGCICKVVEKPQLVQLPYTLFTQQNQDQAEDVIAHELTHRITPKDFSDPKTISSEWFDQVTKILGGSFMRPPIALVKKADKLSDDLNSLNFEYNSQEYLNSRLVYGVKKIYPNELIAVASELYFRGEDRFRKGMSKILEPQQVNDMLTFVKRTIYRQVP